MSHVDAKAAELCDRIWRECDAGAILASRDRSPADVVAALARRFLSADSSGSGSARDDGDMRGRIIRRVVAETVGLGPIQTFVDDPDVAEIMVNGHAEIYVERAGRIERVEARFADDGQVLRVVDRILAPLGRRVDARSPLVDARLPDGSRVNVVVPPLAVDGPCLTIRRFTAVAGTLGGLVDLGAVDCDGELVIRDLLVQRANVLVSGGTSSGKTTLLAATLAECPSADRIVVIEDAAELPLQHPHRVRLEARPAGADGVLAVEVRDLVRNALRMRPDRIVVGEVRGGEAFDLLQALNTGHRGCWSTVHANGPADALRRVETMAACAGTGVPHGVLRQQTGRAFDAVIHLERDAQGHRAVTDIVRVMPQDDGWTVEALHTGRPWSGGPPP